jgi:hypothetical protein
MMDVQQLSYGRSYEEPEGDETKPWVAEGNEQMRRTSLLAILAYCTGVASGKR